MAYLDTPWLGLSGRPSVCDGMWHASLLGALFARPAPLEVEIGCGNGQFLTAKAAQSPSRNYLGIDRSRKYLEKGIKRKHAARLSNLAFLCEHALTFVREMLPVDSVAGFHIYFPDPWPKPRHQKRRILVASFFELLRTRLIPGGFVHAASDRLSYIEQAAENLSAMRPRWQSVETGAGKRLVDPSIYTKYEQEFLAEGRMIYYIAATKQGTGDRHDDREGIEREQTHF